MQGVFGHIKYLGFYFTKLLYRRCDLIRFLFEEKNYSDYGVRTGRGQLTVRESLLENDYNTLGESILQQGQRQ